MKLFSLEKDGGDESHVFGFFLIECKRLFSIVGLKFCDGSRDAYHSHAFNAVSWLFKGKLIEHTMEGEVITYTPSWKPIYTPRDCFHKVVSEGDSYVLTFRGPWRRTWKEHLPQTGKNITLTNGRKVVPT